MSFSEALIIYLSAGAPFGALVFFSRRSARALAVFYAIVATFAWPIFGSYRIYRSIVRRKDQSPHVAGEVASADLLEGLLKEVPVESAEIFEVAGHPNPWLATNCYARSRKKVIQAHIDRIPADEPIEELVETSRPQRSPVVTANLNY